MTNGKKHVKLQGIAIKVLSMWTTASPCERNWSTFDLVHTKRQNKLSPETLEKLVFVHWSTKLLRMSRLKRGYVNTERLDWETPEDVASHDGFMQDGEYDPEDVARQAANWSRAGSRLSKATMLDIQPILDEVEDDGAWLAAHTYTPPPLRPDRARVVEDVSADSDDEEEEDEIADLPLLCSRARMTASRMEQGDDSLVGCVTVTPTTRVDESAVGGAGSCVTTSIGHHASATVAVGGRSTLQRSTCVGGTSSAADHVHGSTAVGGSSTRIDQQICVAAASPTATNRESIPKFDGLPIFCDATKTDPIPWWRQFELKLDIHHVINPNRHSYLYSPSGGACQAWLDNMLSTHNVAVSELHTKISWADLKAAWHKRFQVEPPELQAAEKLQQFYQNDLPSTDWITEYQRLASTPNLPSTFVSIKHFFIRRSCPALQNALTQVTETLTTSEQLFDKASQIILTNIEAKNLGHSSAAGQGRGQHRPKVVVVAATTATNISNKAASYEEGNRLAAARDGGRPARGRGLGKPKTHTTSAPGAGPAAQEPWTHYSISLGVYRVCSNADHTTNFHQRTLTVRDGFDVEVPCTIPLPHSSIRCQVVTVKSFRATCAYERTDEIDLCFLRAAATTESSPTDLSLDPRVVRLLDEFTDIFESPTGVVPDRPISHEIILEAGAVPPKGCIYRMSEEELEVLRAQIDDLLDKGWIRPSSSPYGVPVLFVRKKNKDLRLCIDYHKLNAQTVKNVGPLPRIDDLLERLGGANFFSKLDLKSGYHQISIRPQDCYKFAFKTRYGHFEWIVMSFGLTNAPTTFQAAMTNEFCAMLDRFVLVYLDDILVYSRTLEDHLEHLRRVLETLRRAKYKANRDKCEFVRQELEYLGHFVTPEGISPLSDKIQAIQEWPKPKTVTNVRSFLGLAGYYQHFIKGYSKIVAPLSKLQCEDRPFDFDDHARTSFLALKAALLSAEVLRIYDPLLPTRVTTDASGYGIGAVLEQHDGVDWHPIEYFSKKVPAFRWVMDNNPLVFYKTQDTVNSTIARWMAFIDQFDFFPDHIPGKSNRFADALSRRPDHCTAVYSTFEIDDDLRNSFIHGYQADPEFRDKYANCSSPNPAPSHYRIQEGYLLVHTRGKDLFCVPSDPHLRTRLLGEFHDAPATGYFGVNRTICRLRERFWWPGLLGDVTCYCESCEVCRRCKSRNHRPYGELRPLPVPLRRREAIAMDITGPFPKHKTGVDGILTVVDRLTKFAMFLSCRYHAKAPELAEVLYAGWIPTKGYPKEIVCDCDTRFISDFWLALIKRLLISQAQFSSPPSDRWPNGEGAPDRIGSPSHSHSS
ncbi:hypothetical protein CBR_g31130 [Chara braunii]|uniref:Reverse transcriptase domain-containing protein n=1 Tax=Chara braunii TaxID=69332 RepID=A0A388LED1_CHABU|nr:hypothetical protein CBR_g31130 [Chara braunii]|eukprot:GBG80670.1 hypothetical protein CBR_g31130 [Chara braunii]